MVSHLNTVTSLPTFPRVHQIRSHTDSKRATRDVTAQTRNPVSCLRVNTETLRETLRVDEAASCDTSVLIFTADLSFVWTLLMLESHLALTVNRPQSAALVLRACCSLTVQTPVSVFVSLIHPAQTPPTGTSCHVFTCGV